MRVHAVSINPLDGKIRRGDARLLSGTKFPKTPGLDFAGVVEQVGEGVSGFRVGDAVYGGLGSFKVGYLSERISVPARIVAKTPESLDPVGAAAVTGTDGAALARELGADTVVDYRREAITASGKTFDAVLELSARLPFNEARVLLKPRGVYVDFEPGPAKLASAALQNPFRSQQHRFVITRSSTAALEALGRQFDAGALRPGPIQVFELSEYRRAFELAEKGGLVGKVVVRLG